MYNALSLSRRQPLITGWMIADSGARADIPTMLTHYDTVVRTSSSAATVVIPTMANALANDDFVEPFASLLTKQPPWAEYFWATVVGMPGSLGNAARLRERLHKSNESDEAYRDADLIQALISNQQFDKSADLYHLLVGPKKSRNLVENSSFSTESVYPPFDWQLFSTGEYGAVIVDGKLELSAIRNSGGLFARQLIKMPRRVLTMKVSPERRIPSNAQIFVTLSCAQSVNGAPQSTRIPLKTRIDSLQIDNSRPGCSFYWLDITGRASENGVGFDIALDSISLR